MAQQSFGMSFVGLFSVATIAAGAFQIKQGRPLTGAFLMSLGFAGFWMMRA